jgi:hypothetical protein
LNESSVGNINLLSENSTANVWEIRRIVELTFLHDIFANSFTNSSLASLPSPQMFQSQKENVTSIYCMSARWYSFIFCFVPVSAASESNLSSADSEEMGFEILSSILTQLVQASSVG